MSLVDSTGYNATLTGTPTLLATAAKQMGIPEETLRQWLAEGRLTMDGRPGDRLQ